jgi:hypothetical protein
MCWSLVRPDRKGLQFQTPQLIRASSLMKQRGVMFIKTLQVQNMFMPNRLLASMQLSCSALALKNDYLAYFVTAVIYEGKIFTKLATGVKVIK